MITVVESAKNNRDLEGISRRYEIEGIQYPAMLLSKIAKELYKKNKKTRYAICGLNDSIELVEYSSEQVLKDYCMKNKSEFLIAVHINGGEEIKQLK